jgi:hypothetical protein
MPTEVSRSSFGRLRWTEQDARNALAALQRSGKAVSVFAAGHGLDPQRLYSRRRRLGEAEPTTFRRQRGARTTLDDRQPLVRGEGGRVDTFWKMYKFVPHYGEHGPTAGVDTPELGSFWQNTQTPPSSGVPHNHQRIAASLGPQSIKQL